MLSHISSDDFEFPSTPPSTTGTGMPDDLPASPYYDEAMRRYQALQTAAQRRAQLLPYANNPLNRTLYNTKDALFQDLGKRTNLRLEYYMIKSIHADLVLEGKDEDAVACEQIESVPCEGIKGGQLRAWVGTATKERLRKFVKYLQFDHVVPLHKVAVLSQIAFSTPASKADFPKALIQYPESPTWTLNDLLREYRKCRLLCADCHFAVTNESFGNEIDPEEIDDVLAEGKPEDFAFKDEFVAALGEYGIEY